MSQARRGRGRKKKGKGKAVKEGTEVRPTNAASALVCQCGEGGKEGEGGTYPVTNREERPASSSRLCLRNSRSAGRQDGEQEEQEEETRRRRRW